MSIRRVFINPLVSGPDRADGGIRRVVEAQIKYLPEYGWAVEASPDSAELIVNHGTLCEERNGIPMIAQCHGLYWHDYKWPSWYAEANKRVTEVMTRADAVTVPSEWVKQAVTRGTLINPFVVYHGIDTADWGEPVESFGYGLWNKARTDPVSDHTEVQKIASMLPKVPFVTTFGQETSNVKVLGAIPYDDMKPWVKHAGFYLATVRETFGISILEALVNGVPVVGWDFGGQAEIIQNDIQGILVPPGDYTALAEAIMKVLTRREEYSREALERSRQWGWKSIIGKYARIFDWVVATKENEKPKVSVVITSHNLGRYLEAAVRSVMDQSMGNWECIIIDDASGDETPVIARKMMGESSAIRYYRCPENVGLSAARNIGWKMSTGKYVINLDADDMLDRGALGVLSDALDHDTSLHIASGGLDLMDEYGGQRKRNPWPPQAFDWAGQAAHLNQIPYASMMRRRVLVQSGGYRERDWRAEDASFWLRVTGLGFRAQRVTDKPVLVYRLREGSKGGQERSKYPDNDGDWTKWYPWRAGASTGKEGEAMQGHFPINPSMVPFGAQGTPPKPLTMWPVRHHAHPAVSVIIPVGPGHDKYLVDALDSLVAQTCSSWEAIVVDDRAQSDFDLIDTAALGHPHAHVVGASATLYFTGERVPLGAGGARNMGVSKARGTFLLFLDSDDMLQPTAIEDMLEAYLRSGGGYIYSDCEALSDFSELGAVQGEVLHAAEYDQKLWVSSGYYENMPGRHSVTALVTKVDFKTAGGFDTKARYWEDWKFFMQLAVVGVKGTRVPKPLLLYRYSTGTRRRAAFETEGELRQQLKDEFEVYATGEVEMCSCGGGGGGATAALVAQQALADMQTLLEVAPELNIDPLTINIEEVTSIRLEYIGDRTGGVPYKGKVTRRTYVFSLDAAEQFRDVDPRDVPGLMTTGYFRIVQVHK